MLLVLAAPCLLDAQKFRYTATTGADGLITLTDLEAGVRARISPKAGGELCGFEYRFNGTWTELLYRACDYSFTEGWRGKAPLLWPATGAGGKYMVAGKQYEMPFHGFVQTMPWSADMVEAVAGEARAILSVKDTAETRKVYPFGWRLSVEYRLREGRLFLVYTVGSSVENKEPMHFTIGNHITFRTPFVKGSPAGAMKMETPAKTMLRKDAKNLPNGETGAPPFGQTVTLDKVPVKTAVSLGGYAQDPEVALTDPAGLRLTMRHSAQRTPTQPFVQFNVWGDAGEGYISPEPWVGMQGAFVSRRGLTELAPGKAWEWRVELYPSKSAVQ